MTSGNVHGMPADHAQQYLERLEQRTLKGGPQPPDNGDMEARVAKLEAAMEYVQRDLGEIKTDIREIKRDARTDFRALFGALIVVALGLAGIMAKGFHWL
ncbi:hypothetical protein [Variovorax sp. PBL-E5]|uniref:hypothetical protein n=1 Tax=Variovorax sp. PBL-E5 TaxID=434014 RepID=UPI0013189503|nr:hypothetical protein [Variovorax sp. PBL-E5]VTU37121.1 hypothetical protein E5CHR_04491 [Variovorax sp. PBL-E5]